MDLIPIDKGSYHIMEKSYVDYKGIYAIRQEKAFFVVRSKENLQFTTHKMNKSRQGVRYYL